MRISSFRWVRQCDADVRETWENPDEGFWVRDSCHDGHRPLAQQGRTSAGSTGDQFGGDFCEVSLESEDSLIDELWKAPNSFFRLVHCMARCSSPHNNRLLDSAVILRCFCFCLIYSRILTCPLSAFHTYAICRVSTSLIIALAK